MTQPAAPNHRPVTDAIGKRDEAPSPVAAMSMLLDGGGQLVSSRLEDHDGLSADVRIGGRLWRLSMEHLG